MRQGNAVDPVRVNVIATPPLLADLIANALVSPALSRWAPGDSPALVTIVNAEPREVESRVTIVLSDRLDDPVEVIIDGERQSVSPTRPNQLHELVLAVASALPPVIGDLHPTAG
jgi:hypothetical protein